MGVIGVFRDTMTKNISFPAPLSPFTETLQFVRLTKLQKWTYGLSETSRKLPMMIFCKYNLG